MRYLKQDYLNEEEKGGNIYLYINSCVLRATLFQINKWPDSKDKIKEPNFCTHIG